MFNVYLIHLKSCLSFSSTVIFFYPRFYTVIAESSCWFPLVVEERKRCRVEIFSTFCSSVAKRCGSITTVNHLRRKSSKRFRFGRSLRTVPIVKISWTLLEFPHVSLISLTQSSKVFNSIRSIVWPGYFFIFSINYHTYIFRMLISFLL